MVHWPLTTRRLVIAPLQPWTAAEVRRGLPGEAEPGGGGADGAALGLEQRPSGINWRQLEQNTTKS